MNTTTFVGNLVADPRLVVSDAGKPRATFTVAVNEGEQGSDHEKTHFLNVTAFGTLGENLANSLSKGQRVIVSGRLNTYKKAVAIGGEDKEITMVSFTASAVGPDLRWATAKVVKVVREGNGNGGGESTSAAKKAAPKEEAAGSAAASPAADEDDDF
jgi:single-strand DNA-binding protein